MAALAHNVLKMAPRLGRSVGQAGLVATTAAMAQDVRCDVADTAASFPVLSSYSGRAIGWTVDLRSAAP